MYHQRLANLNDAPAIAPLWHNFLLERVKYDRSMVLKSDFDYISYLQRKLHSPSIFGFVLELEESLELVGFLFVYVQDDSTFLDGELANDSPFQPRRVGGAIGLYIQEEHRKPKAISLLIDAALKKAEALKISDIDLLISREQTGIHSLLERFGFSQSAIQYTKHYEVTEQNLPPLNPVISEGIKVNLPKPNLIPLKDTQTQQTVLNPKGEQVFLHPLRDKQGGILHNRSGLPIYPTPLRDPKTQDYVFNELGELVTCPVVLDELGKVKEQAGIPIFKKPLYEMVEGQLRLKKDSEGNYLFEEDLNSYD